MEKEVKEAIDLLAKETGVIVKERLLTEYLWGCHPELLYFDLYRENQDNLQALDRYLICAHSYLKWKEKSYNVFDISRMCRVVMLLSKLLAAVKKLQETKVVNLSKQFNKMKFAKTQHELEAIFYEIIVAAEYSLFSNEVVFIEETSNKEPDIKITLKSGEEYFIECKKQIRINNSNVELRNKIRGKYTKVLATVYDCGDSIIVEAIFKVHPDQVTSEMLASALGFCKNENRNTFDSSFFSLKIEKLEELPDDNGPYLYTMPKFLFDRYNYIEDGEWMGIVTVLGLSPVIMGNTPENLDVKFSCWSSFVKGDSVLKWKIDNDEILYKIKRLSISKTFEALKQLKLKGDNSIVHYWIESETGHGSREKEFREYLDKILKTKDRFSHIIINETLFNVTPKQQLFDLIEHSHYILGPTAKGNPGVVSIFSDSDTVEGARFGVGAKLPDLE